LFAVDQNEVSSFKINRNGFHVEEVAAPSYRRACADVCAFKFFAVSVVCTKQVSWSPGHADIHVPQAFLTSAYIFATQSLQGVHIRSCMRSLFIRVGGRGWGVSASLCRALVAWRGYLFLTE